MYKAASGPLHPTFAPRDKDQKKHRERERESDRVSALNSECGDGSKSHVRDGASASHGEHSANGMMSSIPT